MGTGPPRLASQNPRRWFICWVAEWQSTSTCSARISAPTGRRASLMRHFKGGFPGGGGGVLVGTTPQIIFSLETRFPGFWMRTIMTRADFQVLYVTALKLLLLLLLLFTRVSYPGSMFSFLPNQSRVYKTNKRTQNRGHNFQDTFD